MSTRIDMGEFLEDPVIVYEDKDGNEVFDQEKGIKIKRIEVPESYLPIIESAMDDLAINLNIESVELLRQKIVVHRGTTKYRLGKSNTPTQLFTGKTGQIVTIEFPHQDRTKIA